MKGPLKPRGQTKKVGGVAEFLAERPEGQESAQEPKLIWARSNYMQNNWHPEFGAANGNSIIKTTPLVPIKLRTDRLIGRS